MGKKYSLNRTLGTILSIPAAMPDYAQIAITNVCNLNCKMCFRHFLKLEIKHMVFDVFMKIVDKLEGVSTLAVTGYGEPFTHPRFFDAVHYCKNKGFKVQTTSNGLLLDNDESIDKLISTGLDSISFSLEGIKGFNEVAHSNKSSLENIRRLIARKKSVDSQRPFITLQTLMFKNREQDLFDIIEWGALNGVDRINIARFELNTLRTVERPNIAEEKIIFEELKRLRKRYNVRIDCLQDQVYQGIKGFLYKHFKYVLGMERHCIRLHDFIYVNVEGNVNPCCALVEYNIGNLLTDNLKKIWNSKAYNKFRKNYQKVPWCITCDFARLKQATIH